MRWSVGDSSNIRVFGDSWLREDLTPRLMGPTPLHLLDLRVKDLLLQGAKRWNLHFLHEHMLPHEVDAILRVPLFASTVNDCRVWRGSDDGYYTVKTAYDTCLSNLVDSSMHTMLKETGRCYGI